MTKGSMGVAVRYPANEFILRENAKRLVNAGVEAQRLKRDNPYLQETLRRLEQIQAEARQTMSEVSAHNERRLAALHGATRKNDRRLLDQMHQLLPRIEQRTRYRGRGAKPQGKQTTCPGHAGSHCARGGDRAACKGPA